MITKTFRDIEASPELLREYIEHQTCWICGKEGWKSLAMHLVKKHGLPSAQVREMAYMLKRDRLISQELHERLQKTNILNLQKHRHGYVAGEKQPPRVLSTKRRDELRQRVEDIRPLIDHDQFKKPHPCPVCGTFIPATRPTYCSEKCSKEAWSKKASAAMTPERIALFKTVIYKPTPEERSAWATKFWQNFHKRPKKEQKEFYLRRVESLKAEQVTQTCPICGDVFTVPIYRVTGKKKIKTCRKVACSTELKRRASIGRKHTEESKQKMSEYAKLRHEREGGRFGALAPVT